MPLISLILIFSFFTICSLDDLDPIGNYVLENQISKSKTIVMYLKIKRKSYELRSNDPFKADFTEYGTWELNENVLTLKSKLRKDKYEKGNSYGSSFRKQEYEYDRTEKFTLYEDQLCSKHAEQKGKGFCFMKE